MDKNLKRKRKQQAIKLAKIGLGLTAVGTAGFYFGYTKGYGHGTKFGIDGFASYVCNKYPNVAEVLLKEGVVYKK